MLHISRKAGEGVIIDGQVEIQVLEVKGKTVKLGVRSPQHMPVLRQEIFESIRRENTAAVDSTAVLFGQLIGKFPEDADGN
jgi:carbon storage regulator